MAARPEALRKEDFKLISADTVSVGAIVLKHDKCRGDFRQKYIVSVDRRGEKRFDSSGNKRYSSPLSALQRMGQVSVYLVRCIIELLESVNKSALTCFRARERLLRERVHCVGSSNLLFVATGLNCGTDDVVEESNCAKRRMQ